MGRCDRLKPSKDCQIKVTHKLNTISMTMKHLKAVTHTARKGLHQKRFPSNCTSLGLCYMLRVTRKLIY